MLSYKGTFPSKFMSEEQLSALLAKLKEDTDLLEKFKGISDVDAGLNLAKEAGFDVSKADWLDYQATRTLELSDQELERAVGGALDTVNSLCGKRDGVYETDSELQARCS